MRNGLKYDDPYAEWHLTATHTHFHSKSYDGESILDKLAQSPWKVDVDMTDLEFGKMFASTRFFHLTPHLGVRSTWMHQKISKNDAQNFLTQSPFGNNCLALGARGGMDTLCALGKNLSFFGDGAISWLYGYHNIHERNPFASLSPTENFRPGMSMSMFECSAGLEYQKKFIASRRCISVKIGYEVNYFFDRNRWVNGVSDAQTVLEQNSISLQGLSLGFRFDF
jgi:hypothetical protein